MIYDWPDGADFAPLNGSFRLVPISQISASPYTGAMKAVNLALIWQARFEVDLKLLPNANNFQGFIESLEGPTHAVRLFDRWRPFPRLLSGGVSGFSDGTLFSDGSGFTDGYAPLVVTAADQGARFVHVEGLPVSQACFQRSDLIGIGGYLYETRPVEVSSNADGEAVLPILPGLRAPIAPSDQVTLWKPRVAMRLVNGVSFEVARQNNYGGRVELVFAEDIP